MLKQTVYLVALWALALAQQSFASDIIIGQVTPLSGPLAPTGIHTRAGAQLYFDVVNARGGVHGRKIKLITRDDGYQASETLRLAKALIDDVRPLAFFGVCGTGNVELLLSEKILADAETPLVAVRTGASTLSRSNNPWLFMTRASYATELDTFLKLSSGAYGFRNYAILYQNDAYGLDVMASAEALMSTYDGKIISKASYEKNTTDVSAAAKTIAAAAPQVVIMVANTAASSDFVKLSREAGNTALFYALSVVEAAQVVQRIGNKLAHGILLTQVVPSPESGLLPIAREVMDSFSKFKPSDVSANPTLLEGYLGAKVLVEGLRRAGPNPTGRKLRDALEQIKDYDVGGVVVDFSPSKHVGVDYVDITIVGGQGKLLR